MSSLDTVEVPAKKSLSAPTADKVLMGELILPQSSGEAVIEEAIAEAMGTSAEEIVYEIIFRQMKAGAMHIRYRALTRLQWQKFSLAPRSTWPFNPREEKKKDIKRREQLCEGLFLAVAAAGLVLGIWVQAMDVSSLLRYTRRLDKNKMTVAANVSAPLSTPQEHWARELNALVHDLGALEVQISSFDFSTTGGSVSVTSKKASEDEIEEVITKVIGPRLNGEITQIKEGTWAWRE